MGPLELFLLIACTAIGGVLATDLETAIPKLCIKLIFRAARRLPPQEEARYAEEWLAALGEMDERSTMLLHALGCYFVAAPQLERAIRGGNKYTQSYKRWFDLGLVVLSAPYVAPIMLLLAFLVRRDGGPAFYFEDRVGRDGRVFRLRKLRSMVVDADARLAAHLAADPALRAEWDATRKVKNDPRITAVGRLLRKASLDDLPQLWNVFRGDMSLVGPYPILPEQRAIYPGRAYYRMRPGLIGLWQVSDRDETSFADLAEFDADYAKRQSLLTDLAIMVRTICVVWRDLWDRLRGKILK